MAMPGERIPARRRGRPKILAKPAYTTSVRVDVKKYEWLKKKALFHPKEYNLSRIVDTALEQLMKADEQDRPPTPKEVHDYLEREGKAREEARKVLHA